jgi:glycosyltransferase involved in cell wall biosynthesis
MTVPTSPVVSVIIPTHDRPERLARAVSSVLGQTYRRLEVIVVDDGSNPPVRNVVERAAAGDDRVRYLQLGCSRGAAAARNRGLAGASGDLVAFLDDDDRWLPTKAERQIAFLRDHPAAVAVSCRYAVVREGRRRVSSHRAPSSCSFEGLLWGNFVGGFSTVMCRRSAVGEDLVLDEAFPSLEDWDLWLRVARRGPIPVLGEVLCRFTVHGGPRLSAPASELRGWKAIESKYRAEMNDPCRIYHLAHQRMLAAEGWRHRLALARMVSASGSPLAAAIVGTEQAAVRLGRAFGDPGLASRVVHRLVTMSPPHTHPEWPVSNPAADRAPSDGSGEAQGLRGMAYGVGRFGQ